MTQLYASTHTRMIFSSGLISLSLSPYLSPVSPWVGATRTIYIRFIRIKTVTVTV